MNKLATALVVSVVTAIFGVSSARADGDSKSAPPPDIIVETITYPGPSGPLGGIIARPAKLQGKAPAVLAMHGGENAGLQRAMQWLIERLAARGYVALSGTYRAGAPSDDLADCKAAVDYLTKLDYVDGSRIGMTGQSRGAGNSFRMAANDPRILSIVPIAGGGGGLPGLPPRNELALSESRFMRGIRTAGGYPEELTSAGPSRTAAPPINPLELKMPVLAVQGTWDLFAPAEGALKLKEEAKARGLDNIKVNVIVGMGHFFDTPRGVMLDEIGTLVADWFDEKLSGKKINRDFEKPLSLPDTSTLEASARYSVKSIAYKAGTESVPALLVAPTGGTGKCCVLYAPDGHTAAEATRLGFLIKAMGESGYTVLVTQYRSDVADVTDDADLTAGLDYLGTLPGAESARLSIVGHGRGGMAALRVASKDKRVKGVVSLSAPSNLTRLLKGLRAYSPASADFQASRIAPTATSRMLSPTFFASAVKVPVFIIHGSLDLMVPPEHALWNAMDLLATGNNQVEMYLAPWDIHYYDSTFAFLKPEQWVGRVTSWLDKVGATTSH